MMMAEAALDQKLGTLLRWPSLLEGDLRWRTL